MKPARVVLLPTLLLLCALFAGCTDAAVTTTLQVDFAGRHANVDATVHVDLSARPSRAAYEAADIPHPGFFSAHDQIEAWSKATGKAYAATSFNSTFGTGFFLTAIDGVVADGSSAYWSLAVNGEVAMKGMSDIELHKGDRVTWTYTALEADAGSTDGSGSDLGLTVRPVEPTQSDTVRLSGSVAQAAKVSVSAKRAATEFFAQSVEADGDWSLDLSALPYGRSQVTVTADDGAASQVANLTVVRLAPFTLEIQYFGYPGVTDVVQSVLMDVDAFPSAPAYEGKSAPHPDFANVHDLTVQWAQDSGANVEVAWSEGLQGYSMSKINGAGSPLSGAPPYWTLEVNNETAGFGMTLMPVAPGDFVTWCLSPALKCT